MIWEAASWGVGAAAGKAVTGGRGPQSPWGKTWLAAAIGSFSCGGAGAVAKGADIGIAGADIGIADANIGIADADIGIAGANIGIAGADIGIADDNACTGTMGG